MARAIDTLRRRFLKADGPRHAPSIHEHSEDFVPRGPKSPLIEHAITVSELCTLKRLASALRPNLSRSAGFAAIPKSAVRSSTLSGGRNDRGWDEDVIPEAHLNGGFGDS